MGTNPYRRLRSETVTLTLRVGEAQHKLDASMVYDETGVLCEVAFAGLAKAGQGLDLMLRELGFQLSHAIQGRDPDTGVASTQSITESALL
jgi:hypothetical protein